MVAEIFTFIAGIGVFLFSLKMLSTSLEDLCGNQIRKNFNKISNNRFKSAGLGFILATIMQSDTASILTIVGFTSAGIISLFQAFAITLGSDLGSSIAAYLVSFSSFNIMEIFCAVVGIGAFMNIFSKKEKIKKIANILISFGLIFVGLELMSIATAVFKTNETFLNFFTTISNPFLLILIGTAFATLIQSSLGTLAILITLIGTSTTAGVLSFESAVYLAYGAKLGSAITTAIVASLNSSIDGKRVGVFHVLNRLIGVIFFGLLSFTPWLNLFSWITEPALRLATMFLIFNLTTTLICFPLIKPLIWLTKKIIPHKKQKVKNEFDIVFVENESKSVAIAKASEKIVLFFDEAHNLFNKTINFVQDENQTDIKKMTETLQEFVNYNNKLNKYIVQIPTSSADMAEKKYVDKLIIINKQVDRNARNCIKILRTITDKDGKKINFSAKTLKTLSKLNEKVDDLFDLCESYVKHPDCDFSENNRPNFNSIINTIQEISTIKLNIKTNIMKNGFNSQLSIKKNTSFLYILNYITLISNNILDFAFAFETDARQNLPSEKEHYEQLDLDDLERINNLSEDLEKINDKKENLEDKKVEQETPPTDETN